MTVLYQERHPIWHTVIRLVSRTDTWLKSCFSSIIVRLERKFSFRHCYKNVTELGYDDEKQYLLVETSQHCKILISQCVIIPLLPGWVVDTMLYQPVETIID